MNTRITSFESMFDLEEWSIELEALQRARGMVCDPVSQASCTLIQTANSFYLFRVMDPDARRGLLVGGALSEGPVSALLIGALHDGSDAVDGAWGLSVGVRAVFLVERNGVWKSVITSRIARLAHSPARVHETRTAA